MLNLVLVIILVISLIPVVVLFYTGFIVELMKSRNDSKRRKKNMEDLEKDLGG